MNYTYASKVRYAKKHDLLRRCRLNTEVLSVERDGLRWKVFMRSVNSRNTPPESLICDKLIMAVGITSKPRSPNWDLSRFDGFHFHAKEMGKRQKELVADDVKNVTIIGGHKSALEAVGTCAQAGKNVEWLVRPDGGGPTWLMPAKDPKGNSLAKMSTVRMMAALNPTVYRKPHWLEHFLHSGSWWLGTWLFTSFWTYLTSTIKGDRYKKSSNMKKLEPHPKKYDIV
jgi:dimethylaniline monooxygenase (N-oxide forming)